MTDGLFIASTYKNNIVGYVTDILKVKLIEPWQLKVLKAIDAGEQRIAVSSGHGIGKTALTAWITHWFNATRPNPQGVVTANTENQLKTKTWRELSKWNELALNKDWFVWTATKFYFKEAQNTWFTSAIPWTENRSEAFAGTHEDHILYIFDEASAIADIIWEVSEGAMTTQESDTTSKLWIVFGNPTKNTGRFRECFGKYKHRWKTFTVDSREVSFTDKKQIAEWLVDYGEDSDFARVRVKGEFPRSGSNQFISSEDVEKCMNYTASGYEDEPVILALDVARFGDDQNVIVRRQGRKVNILKRWRNVDTMLTTSYLVEAIDKEDPDIVFIDGDGVGGGVVDRAKQLVDPDLIYEIHGGAIANDHNKYFNKRVEMWGDMRDAIKDGLDLPDEKELKDDLISPEYGFDGKNRIQLEKKSDMKSRGINSPDCGDGVAMTYGAKVTKRRKQRSFGLTANGSIY